ncbi:MAG: response regulator [Verrucomicrobia bacterium]|jgi:FixJ family two-component response regulator|nr:response regulator [Verrucomicrobiota bacterium]
MRKPEAVVCVVDDDASVRKGLERAIKADGMSVLTFPSAREFLDSGMAANVACLVLDVRMPGVSGLDLQAELNSRRIKVPVVFITGHGTIPLSVQAMRGGAVDFLTKPFEVESLLAMVREAVRKHEGMKAERAEDAIMQGRVDSLTPRERQVMDLVVKGLLNKQIAAELGAAERTIKVHRGRVMQKMEVDSVAELVRVSARLSGG